MTKIYYKNGDSATDTYRALRGDYSLQNSTTMQAIGKIEKNFEETGVDTRIERLCVVENPIASIPPSPQEL